MGALVANGVVKVAVAKGPLFFPEQLRPFHRKGVCLMPVATNGLSWRETQD
jgi:hypothetical protein